MLQSYVSDTLDYLFTVTKFCNRNSKWVLERETELDMLRDIQENAIKLNLSIGHVFKSTDKGKAIGEYWKSMLSSRSKHEELVKELTTVLENTLEGNWGAYLLPGCCGEACCHFSTCVHGWRRGCEAVSGDLPPKSWDSISAARLVCPLLQFKRDAGVFFHPSLHNVAVFVAELDQIHSHHWEDLYDDGNKVYAVWDHY